MDLLDRRDLLRAIVIEYAERTGRVNCEVLVGDLVEIIGEMLAAADYHGGELEEIAEDLRCRIIEAANRTAAEMLALEAQPLGGKH